jgi:hypothetical protein
MGDMAFSGTSDGLRLWFAALSGKTGGLSNMSGIELLKANRDEHGYWQTVRRVARQDTVLNARCSFSTECSFSLSPAICKPAAQRCFALILAQSLDQPIIELHPGQMLVQHRSRCPQLLIVGLDNDFARLQAWSLTKAKERLAIRNKINSKDIFYFLLDEDNTSTEKYPNVETLGEEGPSKAFSLHAALMQNTSPPLHLCR